MFVVPLRPICKSVILPSERVNDLHAGKGQALKHAGDVLLPASSISAWMPGRSRLAPEIALSEQHSITLQPRR